MKRNTWVTLAAVVLAVAVIAPASFGQTNFMGGLHFNAGFPQGDFKDQLDKNAFGIGGQFFYAPARSAFAVGVEFGYTNYGNETRRERFSTTIPDVTVEVSRSNNIVDGFFIFRTQLPRGPIQPYADGLVGFNYLYTETKISDPSDGDDEIASSTNQDDVAFAYGAGAGFMVRVYDGAKVDGRRPISVMLDSGIRYVMGGKAEYLKKGSIRNEGGVAVFDTIESETDRLRLHVGVMVRF